VAGRGLALVPVLALSLTLGGCYTYQSMTRDQPVPAQAIELTLNDRGRIALERNVGPDVLTVAGAVESVSDSGFVLKVQRVTDLNRNISRWAGEPVAFRTEWVRQLRERRFSGARTAILIGSTAGALALAVTTPLIGSILGINNGPSGNGGDPPDN
jgi:hypothetical protein